MVEDIRDYNTMHYFSNDQSQLRAGVIQILFSIVTCSFDQLANLCVP